VSFGGDYTTGEYLVLGTSRNPLYDTLRVDEKTGEDRQKMVDTSLVCDLLCLARSRDSRLADDDDFVPALFTAEAWQARVVMLHNPVADNRDWQLRTS
jgi:hypothetical protein